MPTTVSSFFGFVFVFVLRQHNQRGTDKVALLLDSVICLKRRFYTCQLEVLFSNSIATSHGNQGAPREKTGRAFLERRRIHEQAMRPDLRYPYRGNIVKYI